MSISYQLPNRKRVLWVLVTDSRQARFFTYRKVEKEMPFSGTTKIHYFEHKSDYELIPVTEGVLNAESIDNYQIGHDRRGKEVNSVTLAHNTFDPHGNIKEELRQRFAKAIATRLERAFADKAFDRLVLAAPAKMIGELREQLAPAVQNHIAAVLPKDLAAYEGHTLLSHLQDTLTEAQAA